jgi:RND family efflux transporter MFP subunit
MRQHFVATSIAVIAIAAFAGCEQETIVVAPEAPRVSVMPPEVRELSDHEEFNGWMAANEIVEVRSHVRGHIQKVNFTDGQYVKKGDLLFTVDDDLQKADVVVRNTAVINAQQAFDRAKELLKSAAGTQRTYDDAEAALRQAKANLE